MRKLKDLGEKKGKTQKEMDMTTVDTINILGRLSSFKKYMLR